MKAYLLLLAIFLIFGPTPAFALECGEDGAPVCIGGIVPLLKNLISLLAPAAAIAFLIMLIIGSYQFITSGGDPKAVGAARSTLTYAIIGVILVVVVWLILVLIAGITGITEILTVKFE